MEKEKIKEKKKKNKFLVGAKHEDTKTFYYLFSYFFSLSSCVCVLSLWKHLFNNKSAPQHVIVWCVDGDKKEEKESLRERENSLGWISHELSKNPRPLRFAMAERKKEK